MTREKYQAKCSFRRHGKVIEQRIEDKWNEYGVYDSINRAKRGSSRLQKNGKLLYVVKT